MLVNSINLVTVVKEEEKGNGMLAALIEYWLNT